MYEYDFHTYSIRRKSSKKKPFFFIIVIGCLVFFLFSFFSDKKEPPKEKTQTEIISGISDFQEPILQTSAVGEEVKSALAGTNGSYAVVIDRREKDSYMLNEHRVYDAGSLYKLWVMAVVYQQIQSGKLTEDTILEGDIAKLNEKFQIASESAELTEGSVSFTIASALRQMITISHNYAALLLTEKVKLSTVSSFLKENGFKESKVGTNKNLPKTTASDIALFFEKLYMGELANEEYTQKMISLLKEQRLNNKLPLYLPEETIVAHKTGELGLVTHDGGVVYLPNGEFYTIVVMTETTYPPGAEERIAQISKNVYEYFTQ